MFDPLVEQAPAKATIIVTTERVFDVPPTHSFASNAISTAKYNCLTFVPKNLWYQFHRLANVYFLIIAILQMLPQVSVSEGIPTILLPLLLVLAVSAAKDLIEDWRRKRSDKEENQRRTLKWQHQAWQSVAWQSLRVGDLVKVQSDEPFPADLLLLSASDPQGTCYVETKNIDGETNLKLKKASRLTRDLVADETRLSQFSGNLRCEGPNPIVHQFNGVFTGQDVVVPVQVDQFLLRGSSLKNTHFVIAMVVYTGHETKVMLNSSKLSGKYSLLETQMNRQIVYVFGLQLLLCCAASMSYTVWFVHNKGSTNVYLGLEEDAVANATTQFILMFFSWMLIFTNFVPISLIVTLEMVKFFQALFIAVDLLLYYEVTDTPAEVHSSNLNEELGQVNYIFSDKTGTLTCNVMEFRKCSISGHAYGLNQSPPAELKIPNVDFVDPELNPDQPDTREFFLCLALCHSVVTEESLDGLQYLANSPDELALVSAAKYFGLTYLGMDSDKIISVQTSEEVLKIQLLNILEFTSDRKRMSVIVRMPDQSIKLICKGADSEMTKRLIPSTLTASTFEHIEAFAVEGLRTLVVAQKQVYEEHYQQWNKRLTEVMNAVQNRAARVEALAEELEQDLLVLGATAIADKLQDGVTEAIESFRQAGITVWVLTGDKSGTAINIGFACNLLTPEMVQLDLTGHRSHIVQTQLAAALEIIHSSPRKSFAMVLSGEALIRLRENVSEFLEVLDHCKVVIAARVSPQQKATLVKLIKTQQPYVRTLAIGDGANDVNMISAAHIGIGIAGVEGKQAVRASDFAVAQFAFLKRLMFVHGREAYRRNAALICYNFYKNFTLVMPLFFYGIYSAFSGQSVYNSWIYQNFNVAFTALPIIFYAVFDKEMPYEVLEQDARHYRVGMTRKLFNSWEFWKWLLEAIIQGLILCVVSLYLMCNSAGSDQGGRVSSLHVASCMMFALVVIIVNVKIVQMCYTQYWFTLLIVVLSVAAYFFLAYLLTDILPIMGWLENYNSYRSTSQMLGNANFYVGSLWVVVTAFILQPILQALRNILHKKITYSNEFELIK